MQMDKVDVEKLLRQMDPSARMENDVADVLTDFAIDYIDAIVVRSCELAKTVVQRDSNLPMSNTL